jgi:hypothetical protein
MKIVANFLMTDREPYYSLSHTMGSLECKPECWVLTIFDQFDGEIMSEVFLLKFGTTELATTFEEAFSEAENIEAENIVLDMEIAEAEARSAASTEAARLTKARLSEAIRASKTDAPTTEALMMKIMDETAELEPTAAALVATKGAVAALRQAPRRSCDR